MLLAVHAWQLYLKKMRIKVGVTDVDAYGIVHHPMYLVWCEKAVTEYICTVNLRDFNKEIPGKITGMNLKFQHMAQLYEELCVQVKSGKKIKDDLWKFPVSIMRITDHSLIMGGELFIGFGKEEGACRSGTF